MRKMFEQPNINNIVQKVIATGELLKDFDRLGRKVKFSEPCFNDRMPERDSELEKASSDKFEEKLSQMALKTQNIATSTSFNKLSKDDANSTLYKAATGPKG